ncbi:MAG: hypothetical protein OES46_21030 [Gammaproteobacteria bacterium]|nr:hypothetical protein [Gammaproteobacteria bacterium]
MNALTQQSRRWPNRKIRGKFRGVGAAGALGTGTNTGLWRDRLARRISSLPGLKAINNSQGTDYWLDRRYWGEAEDKFIAWPVLLTLSPAGKTLLRLSEEHRATLFRAGWATPSSLGCCLHPVSSGADMQTIWRIILMVYCGVISPVLEQRELEQEGFEFLKQPASASAIATEGSRSSNRLLLDRIPQDLPELGGQGIQLAI